MEHQKRTLSGKRIFAIVGASLIAFIIIIATVITLNGGINTQLAATHSTNTPNTSKNLDSQSGTPQLTIAGTLTPTQPIQFPPNNGNQPADNTPNYNQSTDDSLSSGNISINIPSGNQTVPDTSSTTDNTTQPTQSTTPTYSQYYWYCWNSGDPSPHHLGYPVSGDHICSDQELHAAHWSNY